MSRVINEVISALLQVGVFTLIPFIFFLFRKDKTLSFPGYIGFYRAPRQALVYAAGASLVFVMAALGVIFIDQSLREVLFTPGTVTGTLRQMGLNSTSFVILLIVALLKTSLAEEILFRGFIAKRLIHRLGFKAGNILQALIFGTLHLLLFSIVIKAGFTAIVFIFLFSTLAGWMIGVIKEKHAHGSILPGWLAHATGNAVSYFIIAFVL